MDGHLVALSAVVCCLLAIAYAMGRARGCKDGAGETKCGVAWLMTHEEHELSASDRLLLADIRAMEAALRGE